MSICAMICGLLLLHARQRYRDDARQLAANGELAARLQLTDLCLFTEARYTRHPAMADHHAPFQDHPLALEHFPSGSLTTPPSVHREVP
jgi:hypothetical protein